MTVADTQPLDAQKLLREYLEEKRRLTLSEASDLVMKIAAKVSDKHVHGIAFGAITPDTVVFSGKDIIINPISTSFEEMDKDWVAPELESFEQSTTSSDVYCLGVLFKYMILGNLRRDPGRMPEELQAFYATATATEVKKRFKTAAILKRRLGELHNNAASLQDQWRELNIPISIRIKDKARTFVNRQWLSICLGATLLVVLLAVGYQAGSKLREKMRIEKNLRSVWAEVQKAKDEGRIQDATVHLEHYLRLPLSQRDKGKALRNLIECYRKLSNHQMELQTLVRYISDYPRSKYVSDFNQRAIQLTSDSLGKYGGVTNTFSDRKIIVDGKSDDWAGISPIRLDPPKDNISRSPASDIVSFYCLVSEDTLYLRVDTLKSPNGNAFAFCFGIDANPRTFSDGIEDWDYEIAFTNKISPWIWDLRGKRNYNNTKSETLTGAVFAAGNIFEASIPLATINHPSIMSLKPKTYHMARNRDDDFVDNKAIISTKKLDK